MPLRPSPVAALAITCAIQAFAVPAFAVDHLGPGAWFAPGWQNALVSANGRYRLVYQPEDGNLVELDGSTPIWSSSNGTLDGAFHFGYAPAYLRPAAPGRAAQVAAYAQMDPSGDFNLYEFDPNTQSSGILWTSGTTKNYFYADRPYNYAGATLCVQNDGNLVIYDQSWHKSLWSSRTDAILRDLLYVSEQIYPTDLEAVLLPGESLGLGGRLHSSRQIANNAYHGFDGAIYAEAVLQPEDQNFVVYDYSYRPNPTPVWSTITGVIPPLSPGIGIKGGFTGRGTTVTMGWDGNASLNNGGVPNGWRSGTDGYPGASLLLYNGGDLVVKRRRKFLWDTALDFVPYDSLRTSLLFSDEVLYRGDFMRSNSRAFTLRMQDDGNLVYYAGAQPLWSTLTGTQIGRPTPPGYGGLGDSAGFSYGSTFINGDFKLFSAGTPTWFAPYRSTPVPTARVALQLFEDPTHTPSQTPTLQIFDFYSLGLDVYWDYRDSSYTNQGYAN
jgi:hypothetical protein